MPCMILIGVGYKDHTGHVHKCISRVNGQYKVEFGVGVGMHQGSVLSPLVFIQELEAL